MRRPVVDRREPGTTPGEGANDRFPGYDVLAQSQAWDAETSALVLARIGRQNDLRFFDPVQEACAGVLLDDLLAQHTEPKVPVLQMIDARLAEARTDGWRYADMPEDGAAWRRTLGALDEDARRYSAGRVFAELDAPDRARLLNAVQDLGSGLWYGLPATHVWSLWTRYACTAFYSHPWAWNEIGFGGPAYPRGYLRLGVGLREPWEVADHAPRDPVADGSAPDADGGRP